MKKIIFVYIFSFFLVIFMLSACNSNNINEANESATAEVDTVLTEKTDEETEAEAADLVLLAFMNNRLQYHMSELAINTTDSESVRELAQSIMEAQEEIRIKIEELAQASNTNLPEAVGTDQKMKLDSIQNLPQEQFDKAYLTEIVDEYQENTERLNELIEEGDNPITAGVVSDIKDIEDEQLQKVASLLEELS